MSGAPNISAIFGFSPGKQLTDGGELKELVDLLFGYENGITAYAGGGQTHAYQLTQSNNKVETCVTNADSVKLPIALPGRTVLINNATAQTLAVLGTYNPNLGAIDRIAPNNSNTLAATGTGVSQSTAVLALYTCAEAGEWKQGLLA